MYNRYIPQPDGSYKRRMMEDRAPSPPEKIMPRETAEQEGPPAEQAIQALPQKMRPAPPERSRCRDCPKQKPSHVVPEKSAGAFLKDLLPKDLDTGDLLVIVLLLLMSADGSDDQGNALLTLALYLFM